MEVRIIRSKRRSKTIQAREVEGGIEILAPYQMSDTELAPYIERFQKRVMRRRARKLPNDAELGRRANSLNRQYFGGRLQWRSIRWSKDQMKRFGSCTPEDGTIRISTRLAEMPRFVQDYVIVHELAHLEQPNHGASFWELVNQFPKTERARGYLMAVGLEGLEDS
jgi:predicted metal-dependent hydrolase